MTTSRAIALGTALAALMVLGCGETGTEEAASTASAHTDTGRSPFDVEPMGSLPGEGAVVPAPSPDSFAVAPEGPAGARETGPGGGTFRVAGVLYDVPGSWGTRTPTSSMRAAELVIPGEAGEAIVAVFGGIGGTVQQNVDRWLGQFPEVTDGPTRGTVEAGGVTMHTISISGTFSASTMMGGTGKPEEGFTVLAAIVTDGPGGPIQIKAVGPKATIDAHMDEWDAMLRSARGG